MMKENIFHICIKTLVCSDREGLGFVDDLARTMSNLDSKETGIEHIAVIWDYTLDGTTWHELDYHYGATINLVPLKRDIILSSDHVLTSSDSDRDRFCGSSFVWYDHTIVIPINKITETYDDCIQTKGALLLMSTQDDIKLDGQQLDTLHSILNSKEPNIYGNKRVVDALQHFKNPNVTNTCIGERWQHTISALKKLSPCVGAGVTHGVCYATFWKLIERIRLKEDRFFKQYETGFCQEGLPAKGHEFIAVDGDHFLNSLRDKTPIPYYSNWDVFYFDSKQYLDSVADKEYFNSLSPETAKLTAVVLPMNIEGVIHSTEFCVLYVRDILYTPFMSLDFTRQLQSNIKADLEDLNRYIQGELTTNLMNRYIKDTKLPDFFKNVSSELAKYNSSEDCLIYTIGTNDDLYYVIKEDINEPSSFLVHNGHIGNRSCYIPQEYYQDTEFRLFLEDLKLLDQNNFSSVVTYRADSDLCVVKTALCICIHSPKDETVSGLIVMINKIPCAAEASSKDYCLMLTDNMYVTYQGALFLHQFINWSKAITRKNYLLRKLRHEIPHCTHVIADKMQDIRDEIKKRHYMLTSVTSNINAIELNRSRINILAKFFGAVDYDDKRFAENAVERDVVDIINSNLPLFKEEAASKGVDVIFNCEEKQILIKMSEFYPLAIINVINNAIRYCSRGTNVFIDLDEKCLKVSDVGLPIKESELDRIFEDGYRGVDAREQDNQGIGYGLHLSKRVLRAHGSDIIAESDYISDHNYFLENAVYLYLKSLSAANRSKYMYATAGPGETVIADQLYNQISKMSEAINDESQTARYYNRNVQQLGSWLTEDARNGGDNFLDMENTWFSAPVANVTFTINF